MIEYLNNILPFSVMFLIESFNIRFPQLSSFTNGCLFFIEKFSSKASIEKKFNKVRTFSSFPVQVLINKFQLKNVIYLNHTLLKYDDCASLTVQYTEQKLQNCYTNYSHQHCPLDVIYFGPDQFSCSIFDDYYYADDDCA